MKRIAKVLITLFSFSAHAQNTHYGGLFPTLDHSGDLTSKLGYGLYYFAAFPLVDLKNPEIGRDANFLLFYSEQSLSYSLSKYFSFTGSYVFQRSNVVDPYYVNENRFYVQAKYKHSFGNLNLAHRIRFDGRFIQAAYSHSPSFHQRARYLFGMNMPIKSKKENLYFTAYEELFFNTQNGAKPVYEENWAYAALGIKLNEKNKIEPGILYIRWSVGQPYWFNQYYLQVTWISHLNFKKG
jgi:hypothetical protein